MTPDEVKVADGQNVPGVEVQVEQPTRARKKGGRLKLPDMRMAQFVAGGAGRLPVVQTDDNLIHIMAASGMTDEQIASFVGLPISRVQEITTRDLDAILKLKNEGPAARIKQNILTGTERGLARLRWLIDHAESQETQRKSAIAMVELGIGKAEQSIIHNAGDLQKYTLEQLAQIVEKQQNQ